MLAWRVHDHGAPREALRLEDVAEPTPTPTQALVAVEAVGLNFADLLSIAGRYQIKAPLPFTPGIEGVGRVLVPESAGTIDKGTRVIFSVPWGALAEKVAVEASGLLRVPDDMPSHEAAAFLVTYQTSYLALAEHGRLRRGELVVVHNGAGGVGSAAIQIAKALGARVVATAGSPEKLDVCRAAGADHVVDYSRENFADIVAQESDGRGADLIYDSVGGDVFDASIRALNRAGRLLVVGFAGGTIPTVAANRVMLRNIAIVGVNWGAYRDEDKEAVATMHERLIALRAKGSLRPVIFAQHPMADLVTALDDLANRRSYGKLVVTVGPHP